LIPHHHWHHEQKIGGSVLLRHWKVSCPKRWRD
jgi:hypothetical protein